MNKEQVYDAEIAPLMAKIIEACKKHQIPMVADFAIGHEADEGLKCTTALLNKEWNPPDEMLRAIAILKPTAPGILMVTETHKDGSKTITAILP